MDGRVLIMTLVIFLATSCIHVPPKPPQVTHVTAPFERYVAENYDWTTVRRIVVMPFANQVAAGFPRVSDEMLVSLATELQRAGRFDIVIATHEDPMANSQEVFSSGQFNELEILRVAREYQADAVLFGNVTQYHPYSPPRIGLSLLLLSPGEGIAIASASGLWDAREKTTAEQAQAYFKRTQEFPRSLMGSDRVTESPNLFQRFVCQQVAVSLSPQSSFCPVSPGAIMPPEGAMQQTGAMSYEGVAPVEGMMPNGNVPPPVPPASAGFQ